MKVINCNADENRKVASLQSFFAGNLPKHDKLDLDLRIIMSNDINSDLNVSISSTALDGDSLYWEYDVYSENGEIIKRTSDLEIGELDVRNEDLVDALLQTASVLRFLNDVNWERLFSR